MSTIEIHVMHLAVGLILYKLYVLCIYYKMLKKYQKTTLIVFYLLNYERICCNILIIIYNQIFQNVNMALFTYSENVNNTFEIITHVHCVYWIQCTYEPHMNTSE